MMSDVKNLWVLKQPLPIPYEIDKSYSVHLDLETYFVRLDVESLTTQLETIIKKAVINAKKVDMSPLNEANALLGITQIGVAEVLELLGMKGKDND